MKWSEQKMYQLEYNAYLPIFEEVEKSIAENNGIAYDSTDKETGIRKIISYDKENDKFSVYIGIPKENAFYEAEKIDAADKQFVLKVDKEVTYADTKEPQNVKYDEDRKWFGIDFSSKELTFNQSWKKVNDFAYSVAYRNLKIQEEKESVEQDISDSLDDR